MPSEPKRLTIMLLSSPYAGEPSHTALSLAEAALAQGYQVTVHATGDGVYSLLTDQKTSGIPNIGSRFERLLAQGATVDL